MAKIDLERQARSAFVAMGCKKVGHVEYLTSIDDAIFVTFLTMRVGRENRVETRVDIRYRVFNELCFYISEYGSEYKGSLLRGRFPGRLRIPNSLHVSGVAAHPLFGAWQRLALAEETVEDFVATCLQRGHALMGEHVDIDAALTRSLKASPPPDYQILTSLFLGRYDTAREVVEQQRESDGVFLAHIPHRSDKYLRDLGY